MMKPIKNLIVVKKNPLRGFIAGVVFSAASALAPCAFAGGGATGGATEFTQLANLAELGAIYAEEAAAYVVQGQQYLTQLENLKKNPFGTLGTEVTGLALKVGQLMDAGKSIGGDLTKISTNIGKKYNNPAALSYSQNFKKWGDETQDTLTALMTSNGMRRDQYKDDASALVALHSRAQTTKGALAATQMVAELAVENIKQLQALGDMTATANIALADFRKQQLAKETEKQRITDSLGSPLSTPVPNITNKAPPKVKSALF